MKQKNNEAKEQKGGGLLGMLRGTLQATLLGNQLTGKGTIRAVKARLKLVRIFNPVLSFN